jgi:hypothetical protein
MHTKVRCVIGHSFTLPTEPMATTHHELGRRPKSRAQADDNHRKRSPGAAGLGVDRGSWFAAQVAALLQIRHRHASPQLKRLAQPVGCLLWVAGGLDYRIARRTKRLAAAAGMACFRGWFAWGSLRCLLASGDRSD